MELVDTHKINAERQQMRDEELELKDFRNRVEKLQEESVDKVCYLILLASLLFLIILLLQKLQAEIKTTAKSVGISATARNTQKSLLGQGIKRKNGELPTTSKVAKTDQAELIEQVTPTNQSPAPVMSIKTSKYDVGSLKCIAILPGIGSYTDSSDSEASTDAEDHDHEKCSLVDLCGRKLSKKKQCAE